MDQSKSSSGADRPTPQAASNPQGGAIAAGLPKRTFSMEFFVGLFAFGGLLCAGYLAVGLGGIEIVPSDRYEIIAEFDNVSGLKYGASVEIAGVPIGEVTSISLQESIARVTLRIERVVQLREDDIASIRTKGIIGDRYVKISRGASEHFIPAGGVMTETESVIDIEDVIGKVVHSLTGEKEEKDDKGAAKDEKGSDNKVEGK